VVRRRERAPRPDSPARTSENASLPLCVSTLEPGPLPAPGPRVHALTGEDLLLLSHQDQKVSGVVGEVWGFGGRLMEGQPEGGVLCGDGRGPPPAPATGFALSFRRFRRGAVYARFPMTGDPRLRKLWPHGNEGARGFRHRRKAGRCGDPLRNVTPENPPLTPPPSYYLAEIAGLRQPGSCRADRSRRFRTA
jgi:hypothetical protein